MTFDSQLAGSFSARLLLDGLWALVSPLRRSSSTYQIINRTRFSAVDGRRLFPGCAGAGIPPLRALRAS